VHDLYGERVTRKVRGITHDANYFLLDIRGGQPGKSLAVPAEPFEQAIHRMAGFQALAAPWLEIDINS
jgi:hypothetical protein